LINVQLKDLANLPRFVLTEDVNINVTALFVVLGQIVIQIPEDAFANHISLEIPITFVCLLLQNHLVHLNAALTPIVNMAL
jgi:hypothetical protein